jgi:hypothetical protein
LHGWFIEEVVAMLVFHIELGLLIVYTQVANLERTPSFGAYEPFAHVPIHFPHRLKVFCHSWHKNPHDHYYRHVALHDLCSLQGVFIIIYGPFKTIFIYQMIS